MKILRSVAIQVILSALCLSGPAFSQVASNPDEAFVTVLYDILSGANPDFEAEVRKTSTYREADEFSRADVLKAEAARLRERYTEVAQYKGITIPVRTSLGEWDSERSGFPIALFKAGAFIKVGQGISPGVAFSNPIEARYWNLSIDIARTIPERISATRSIVVEVTLANLRISAENADRVTGDVTSVVLKTEKGEELGRYDVAAPQQVDDSIDQGAVARGLVDTLKAPQLGTELAVGLDWAQNNASSVAWSVRSFSGPVEYEGMDKGPFPNFVPDADVVRVGFSSSSSNAKGILSAAGFNITQLTSPNWFGPQLDCYTADIVDRCGVLTYVKEGDTHVLAEIIILDDFERTNFRELTKSILGDALAAYSYDENTPTTVGTSIAYKFDGELYYLGPREAGGIPSLDLRVGYRNNYHAPVMLFGFGSEKERAISIARISALPDRSNVASLEPSPAIETPVPLEKEGSIDGLLTLNPEWHASIASGNCLTEKGFGPCAIAETFGPASNGATYTGPTEETSLLLTMFNIYSEECQGAVGPESIKGWCAKRDLAKDQLAAKGVCMGDTGFNLCAVKAEGDLPIFGTWSCGGSTTVINAETYTTVQQQRIEVIEKMGEDYLVTMVDGYRFAAFEVTPTSFAWYSPESGDTFDCRRQ